MRTLAEIQAAISKLPPEQWMEIRRWMDAHQPKASAPEALKIFHQLQQEMRLTPKQAEAWKGAIADARR